MRSNLSLFAAVSAGILCMGLTPFTSAQQQAGVADGQQMLDFLARPLPARGAVAAPPGYPGRFADWTEEQKRSGLQLMVQRCALVLALEHDNPKARILPPSMTQSEEARLAMSVCLPAKMPPDWPERSRYLESARQLIGKADTLGASLHLPASADPR